MEIRIPRRKTSIVMFAMPDIAFLLLIFLILTVTVAEEEEITVPTFEFIQETDFPDTVLIRVTQDGAVEMGGERFASDALGDPLSRVEAGNVIHLLADAEVEYLVVDVVLNALKQAGLVDVILIAESNDDQQ
jgi:biopolymer transport protein ExbD